MRSLIIGIWSQVQIQLIDEGVQDQGEGEYVEVKGGGRAVSSSVAPIVAFSQGGGCEYVTELGVRVR